MVIKMKQDWTLQEKKQIKIFTLVAFGLPVLMGILMGISYYQGNDVSAFPNAQMFYPAAGVMLALLLAGDREKPLPKKFYIGFLINTGVMMLTAAASMIFSDINWMLMGQYPLMVFAIICWILLFCEKKEVRAMYKLTFSGNKRGSSWLHILLFLLLYIFRLFLSCAIEGEIQSFMLIFTNPYTYLAMISLVISFILAFTAFFGEEYGWRYFFQPLLQKRFGLKGGILLLGLLWGIWHLPINIFFYSPDTWYISVILQLINCTSLAIFFGFSYKKTGNVWVPVTMHFINNNMIAVIAGSDAISGQVCRWIDIPIMLIINIAFIAFIFSKEYKDTTISCSDDSQDYQKDSEPH